MNFLAHLALSGDDNEVMVGNFIGDSVKGRAYLNYPASIKKGILMHRAIDYFTDCHESTKVCSQLLQPGYGRYSGVVTDVLFDHFLASEWQLYYPDISLKNFVTNAHMVLLRYYFTLPNDVKGFLPFMISSRRLENYKHLWGIEKSLEIMSHHTSLPPKAAFAMECLNDNYQIFRENFRTLYADIQVYLQDFNPDEF